MAILGSVQGPIGSRTIGLYAVPCVHSVAPWPAAQSVVSGLPHNVQIETVVSLLRSVDGDSAARGKKEAQDGWVYAYWERRRRLE